MDAKIVKHGNSRALIIPAPVADALNWEVGNRVELEQLVTGIATHPPRRRSVIRAAERVLHDHDELFRRLADR